MTNQRYRYSQHFFTDKNDLKIPSINYPSNFTPLVPPIGSTLHVRDTKGRLVYGKLADVSYAFKTDSAILAFHLENTDFSLDEK